MRSVRRYGFRWEVTPYDSVGGAFGMPLIFEPGHVQFVNGIPKSEIRG